MKMEIIVREKKKGEKDFKNIGRRGIWEIVVCPLYKYAVYQCGKVLKGQGSL